MSFVGIICHSKQERYIKQILTINLPNENIIILKEDSIENFKNITFEIIAIFSGKETIFKKNEMIANIIKKAKYLIMNSDEKILLHEIKMISGNIITYGFNTKSTITTSSVNEESILVCIQRIIKNRLEEEIEPQEMEVKIDTNRVNTSTIMGIFSIVLIYGKEQLVIE